MVKPKVTVVQFRAYDRPGIVVFLDKTPEEIHAKLNATCQTYIPTSIMECEVIEFKPLSILNDLIAKEPGNSIQEFKTQNK